MFAKSIKISLARAPKFNGSLKNFYPKSSVGYVFRSFTSEAAKYEMITVEKKQNVGVITLNRPKVLNALCEQLIKELVNALHIYDRDKDVGAIILTGSKKAFAAGADIKEMSSRSYMQNYKAPQLFGLADDILKVQKPIIAAVNGYALGGGCELAMMCDMIIAGDNAKFGQPEITLGTIPGMGGTQRLTRAVGKSKAMEMVLTGKSMDAKQAETSGLVARVVPEDQLFDSAMETASKIASFSKPVVTLAKECVNRAYESSLTEGLLYERRIFYSTFALTDQKEGMKAFVNKTKPVWKDE